MTKFLLTTLNSKYIHLNLAIRILYDLNKDFCRLSFHEFTIKSTDAEILEVVADYDVICFSCYIWNITQTLHAAEIIKLHFPDKKILLGGPEVSYEWQEVINKSYIDYIIAGEGELPFHAFVTAYPQVASVPNLIFKKYNEIYFNKQSIQFPVANLNGRNPYQYDSDYDLNNKINYIETSRGCPYKCEFCLASLDNKVRYLDNETIKNNLLYLMQRGKVIKFLDRTFNIKKDFTIDLFQFILENYSPGNVFQFEITADIIHPDIITFINEHVPKGLFRFEIGIQTVNANSNLAVSRKQNFEKTKSIIKQIEDKIELHLDLIVGLPLDYYDDIKYSFEETFKMFAPELQLGFLKFLKGTPVREKYQEHDYIFDPNPPYQIIESKFLNKEALNNITLLEHALEVYWNKKKAIYTLMYITSQYSIFDFLERLGKFMQQNIDLVRHTLKESYECIYHFAAKYYANDPYILYLITIDYYLYYKVKPQAIFKSAIDKKSLFALIENYKDLNPNMYRYEALALPFDFENWVSSGIIQNKKTFLIIQYTGKEKAKIVKSISAEAIDYQTNIV